MKAGMHEYLKLNPVVHFNFEEITIIKDYIHIAIFTKILTKLANCWVQVLVNILGLYISMSDCVHNNRCILVG